MKRIVSLLLVLVLALSAAALAEGAYPSYLNLDSQIPVVKEGEEAPTLRMILQRRVGGSEWEQLWIAKYIATYLNVKLEVEMVDNAEALAERKTLMFAGGDLPDLIMNMDLSTNDIITYGQMNGQLLKMDEYISEELTPNMVKWFEENPAAKATATTPDGHIYTLPKMMAVDNEGDLRRLFINTAWLEEIGMEAPATLDELLAVLRAMKEKHPDSAPLNGAIDEQNPGYFILNAMGFVSRDTRMSGYGLAPATKDGSFALPCATEEFREYLTIMHDLYQEGILMKNFFLAEKTEVDAKVLNNETAVVTGAPYAYGIDTWDLWQAVSPLTSAQNATPVVNQPSAASVGGFAISATTEYPELCMRFADVFFSHDYVARMMWIGPKDGSEEALGYAGNVASEGGEGWTFPEENYPENCSGLWDWLVGYVSFYANFGSNDTQKTINAYAHDYLGGAELPSKQFDLTNGDQFYRASVWEKVWPYVTEYTFPTTYYLDEDTALRMTDLETVIEPYVKEQVALFINGTRPLDEFDAFQSELKAMDIDSLIEIYQGIWEPYKAAL